MPFSCCLFRFYGKQANQCDMANNLGELGVSHQAVIVGPANDPQIIHLVCHGPFGLQVDT